MEPPIIIEVLDRFGKIRERHRVGEFPCRIGRGYHNEIILDDPYVSISHAELILDGNNNIILNDTASDNGVYNTHPVERIDTVMVQENQRVRIGHTDLRFRTPQFAVKETIKDRSKPHGATARLGQMLLLPLVWLAVSSLLLWNTYLEQAIIDVTFGQVLYKTLPFLIFLPVWAFVWSIVSKIVTHRFYYRQHAIWISGLFIIIYVFELALQYVEFATAIDFLSDRVTLVSDVFFVAILFYGHLNYSTTYSRRKAAVIGTVVGILLTFTIQLTSFLAQPDFNNTPQYSGILKPPAFVLQQGKSIDTFFSDSAALKDFDYSRDASTSE